MVIIRFDEVQLQQRILGYSATGIYLLSFGLYLTGIIPLELHGASLVSAFALIMVVFILPPLHPGSCINVSEHAIRVRTGMFKAIVLRWKDIQHIDMQASHFSVQLRNGKTHEVPVYFLKYGEMMKFKQVSKQNAYRNRVSVHDLDLFTV